MPNPPEIEKLRELLARALGEDHDHMIAEGDDLVWLAAQIANWPTRIHPERTTNDRFLRLSAAATLQSLTERERVLVEALRPFAAFLKGLKIKAAPDGTLITTGANDRRLTLGDLRKARAALSPNTTNDSEGR